MDKREALCYALALRIADEDNEFCRPGTLLACLSAGLYSGLMAYELLQDAAMSGAFGGAVSVESKYPRLV